VYEYAVPTTPDVGDCAVNAGVVVICWALDGTEKATTLP
jgi:hypothetical protein